jgi:hypothetical protein
MIIVTIAVGLILLNCLLAIWEPYGLLRYTRLGKAVRAAPSDPAIWRRRSPVYWAKWLDPELYMTHNPRHGR